MPRKDCCMELRIPILKGKRLFIACCSPRHVRHGAEVAEMQYQRSYHRQQSGFEVKVLNQY